ncbi:MAG: dihydrodipicolinate synthase family protein [Candidatus Bathyarchaeia archaeon]
MSCLIYEEAKKKLRGLAVILLTPWTRDYEIDFDGLRRNVRFLIDNGVVEGKGSLFAACGCGEGPFMTLEEIKAVVKTVVEETDGKVPVFLGTFQRDTKNVIDLLKFGERIGALGAQVAPPYYTQPSQDEIFDFFEKLNASTELGIAIYNNYYSTGTDMTANLVERFAALDRVIGFKWMTASSANA